MGYSFKSSYRFPYSLTRAYLRPRHYINWVRHAYQRVRYGVSFADVWSFDYHLARVLTRALPEFLNDSDSPVIHVLAQDRASDGYWDGTWSEEEREAALGRWDAMIHEIIDSLNAIYGDDGHTIDWYDEEAGERMNKALHQLVYHFRALWI